MGLRCPRQPIRRPNREQYIFLSRLPSYPIAKILKSRTARPGIDTIELLQTKRYSTVTDFAKFLGKSTSNPAIVARWYAISCIGMTASNPARQSTVSGICMTGAPKDLKFSSPLLQMIIGFPPLARTCCKADVVFG